MDIVLLMHESSSSSSTVLYKLVARVKLFLEIELSPAVVCAAIVVMSVYHDYKTQPTTLITSNSKGRN